MNKIKEFKKYWNETDYIRLSKKAIQEIIGEHFEVPEKIRKKPVADKFYHSVLKKLKTDDDEEPQTNNDEEPQTNNDEELNNDNDEITLQSQVNELKSQVKTLQSQVKALQERKPLGTVIPYKKSEPKMIDNDFDEEDEE